MHLKYIEFLFFFVKLNNFNLIKTWRDLHVKNITERWNFFPPSLEL